MAVTCVLTRVAHTQTVPFTTELCSAALTGTYATGGFTANPYTVKGSLGNSPLPAANFRAAQWMSPTGYIYASSVTGNVMTTKIYSAPGTELANGTAVPDAIVPVFLYLSKN